MSNSIINVFDKINLTGGIIMSIPAMILGQYWSLFIGFLVLNIMDYYTGTKKATKLGIRSSKEGRRGIERKVYLWILVCLGFIMSALFKEIGAAVGINLEISIVLGYLVLASLIINEIRSILENLVELDVEVPTILIKGLKVADEKINGHKEEQTEPHDKEESEE